ncbi:uncharacterized protein VTP21DRAFT_615 [Calcarisporiella thermophila]|uniref:uncharacterized protein n=1 Tax=Calcarisporiella thermophila TaxID=911321 RepID=UPI0037429D1E
MKFDALLLLTLVLAAVCVLDAGAAPSKRQVAILSVECDNSLNSLRNNERFRGNCFPRNLPKVADTLSANPATAKAAYDAYCASFEYCPMDEVKSAVEAVQKACAAEIAAKSQTVTYALNRYLELPTFRDFACGKSEDGTYCPIFTLRLYLNITQYTRGTFVTVSELRPSDDGILSPYRMEDMLIYMPESVLCNTCMQKVAAYTITYGRVEHAEYRSLAEKSESAFSQWNLKCKNLPVNVTLPPLTGPTSTMLIPTVTYSAN